MMLHQWFRFVSERADDLLNKWNDMDREGDGLEGRYEKEKGFNLYTYLDFFYYFYNIYMYLYYFQL